MYFYSGGLTYSDLQEMLIPQVLRFNEHARRIAKEEEKAAKRK
jgi:hypothetical protein